MSHLICLILGANAHINYDLALTLRDSIKDEHFYSDYQKVEVIIDLSIEEALNLLNKDFPILRFIDKRLMGLYKMIIKLLMRGWRRNAWKKYLKLKSESISEKDIENDAVKIANNILYFAKIVSY